MEDYFGSVSDVAAIIVTHLFGSPIDFDDLLHLCKASNIAIIEDCAHCLGGTLNGLVAGLEMLLSSVSTTISQFLC